MEHPRVVFATDSELGRYGLGGPASHLARAVLDRFPPSLVMARSAGDSGLGGAAVRTMPASPWISMVSRFRRLQWLLPDQRRERIRFDRWTERDAPGSRVCIVENTTSLGTARRARREGSRVLLLYYNRSFRGLLTDTEEERRRWGGPPTFLSGDLADRAEMECRESDRIVGMSRLVLDDLASLGVPAQALRRARYGVDSARFRPPPIPPEKFVVAFVGWLAPWKGYPYLVEGFRDAAIPGSELLLHGGTSVAFHHGLVERLRGSASVRVVRGPVEETYAKASVLVLPSVSDAYGLVALEAMACGIPVIVTDRCGAAEDVTDGGNGFVVPARDSASIRDRLLRLHGDPPLRAAMGREGRRIAEGRTWNLFCDDVLSVVSELETATA